MSLKRHQHEGGGLHSKQDPLLLIEHVKDGIRVALPAQLSPCSSYDERRMTMKTMSPSNTISFRFCFTCLALLLALAGALTQPLSAQTLPKHITKASSSTLWWITQLGLGGSGEFEINNSGNANPALVATTNGTGTALTAVQNGPFNTYNQVAVSVTSNPALSTAVYATASSGYAGHFDGYNDGVIGTATHYYGNGVEGQADYDGATGVYGHSANGYGGYFEGGSYGIFAYTDYGYALYGQSPWGVAGYFDGNVYVTGTLTAGAKNFKIDHPLDPAKKYLVHACVESDQMINLYRGNVALDTNGQAVVTVPDWFEALNENISYQLTCVGGFAPVYVAAELHKGAFTIAGGRPGLKVCSQITGERHDAYAKAHPL